MSRKARVKSVKALGSVVIFFIILVAGRIADSDTPEEALKFEKL